MKVRAEVEKAFEEWNVRLCEEWIWAKVTTEGECVSELDGVWRKPYEVLLLGMRDDESGDGVVEEKVKRRVIVGVPDLHSRKPCLKTLLEPLLPQGYRALEIFARNLTQGWCAWGNEVLKFNWEGCLVEVRD